MKLEIIETSAPEGYTWHDLGNNDRVICDSDGRICSTHVYENMIVSYACNPSAKLPSMSPEAWVQTDDGLLMVERASETIGRDSTNAVAGEYVQGENRTYGLYMDVALHNLYMERTTPI